MKVNVNGINYNLIENYNESFDENIFKDKYTDYFSAFDYIVGDFAYSKLRLKGFYKSKNKNVKEINDFKNLKKYINENCAYGCKYFVLEKESD